VTALGRAHRRLDRGRLHGGGFRVAQARPAPSPEHAGTQIYCRAARRSRSSSTRAARNSDAGARRQFSLHHTHLAHNSRPKPLRRPAHRSRPQLHPDSCALHQPHTTDRDAGGGAPTAAGNFDDEPRPRVDFGAAERAVHADAVARFRASMPSRRAATRRRRDREIGRGLDFGPFARRLLPPRLHPGITQKVAPNESRRAPNSITTEARIYDAFFVTSRSLTFRGRSRRRPEASNRPSGRSDSSTGLVRVHSGIAHGHREQR